MSIHKINNLDRGYLVKLEEEFGLSYNTAYASAVNKKISTYKKLYEYYVEARDIVLETTSVVSGYNLADLVIITGKSSPVILSWLASIYSENSFMGVLNVKSCKERLKMIREFVRTNGKVGVVDLELDLKYENKIKKEFGCDTNIIHYRRARAGFISSEELYYMAKHNQFYVKESRTLINTLTSREIATMLGVTITKVTTWRKELQAVDVCTKKRLVEKTLQYMGTIKLKMGIKPVRGFKDPYFYAQL